MIGLIGGALAIGGALINADSSRSAANTQADAARQATQTQLQMFDQQQANLQPWMAQGKVGLDALGKLLFNPDGSVNMNSPLLKQFTAADFQSSPGYKFQLQQGIDAIQNSAAAKGLTGNTLRELTSYGQGLANQDWWNAYNAFTGRQKDLFGYLNTLSSTGANTAGGIAGLGAQVAGNVGSNQIAAGNAMAAGQVGAANALAGGANSAFQNYMLYSMMNGQGANMTSPYGDAAGVVPGGYTAPDGTVYNNPSAYTAGP